MRWLLLALLIVAAGCHDHPEDAYDHEHAHHHEGPEPIAVTRWTEAHELFVEFDPPEPGKKVGYHAHVTRLKDFQPATAGHFAVRYYRGDQVAAETSVDGVLRAGIFAPEGPAPAKGRYRLEMRFEHGKEKAVFDCGEIDVPGAASAEDDAAALSFLKEQQWRVPFATAWATQREMAREIELPAILESAGGDQLTIASPTDGRFFHSSKLAITEGLVVEKGDVIGSISPTVAGDDFSRLQLAVDEARLERQRWEREIKRIEPLVKDQLLPEKRLIEAKSELATAKARLQAAQRRLGQVVSPGGEGGVPLRASKEGVVATVLVDNGAPVEAGEPLIRLIGTGKRWAKARFVARPLHQLSAAKPVAIRTSDGKRIALAEDARFVSLQPVVDQDTQLASWTADLGSVQNDELTPGLSAVLLVRVGKPEKRLAVPVEAVVELNTRPFVFVQVGGESFHKREVVTGARDGGFVQILQGVSSKERIVTRGGFDIHLASVMGAVESHHH